MLLKLLKFTLSLSLSALKAENCLPLWYDEQSLAKQIKFIYKIN